MYTIRIQTGDDQHPSQYRSEVLEFPYRPTEAELKLALAQFFGKLNFRFDENLDEVRDCMLLTSPPTWRKSESSSD